jgi:hypothetical protein
VQAVSGTVVPENPVALEMIELGCLPAQASAAMFEVLISFLRSFRVYFRTQSDNQAGSVGTGPGKSDTDMLDGQAFPKKHGN